MLSKYLLKNHHYLYILRKLFFEEYHTYILPTDITAAKTGDHGVNNNLHSATGPYHAMITGYCLPEQKYSRL